MNDSNTGSEKKPRAPKSGGPKSYLVTDEGNKEWLVTLSSIRVATAPDLMRALGGKLPTAKLEAAS